MKYFESMGVKQDHHSNWLDFIQGDAQAFRQLYENYVDVLFSFGCRYSCDESLVKDSIHDLFLEIHKYRTRLSKNVNVKFYLMKSLKRILFRALKKQSLLEPLQEEDGVTFYIDQHRTDWNQETQMIQTESENKLFNDVSAELCRLPARQQEAIYLKYHAEFTYEEVSDLMNVSVATCRTLVYRGMKQLKEKLESVVTTEVILFNREGTELESPFAFLKNLK